jgi:hypothetical protein
VAIAIGIIYNRAVHISVMDHCAVYVNNSGVILKSAATPSAAAISIAAISKPIVNTAIEAHRRTPITKMKPINTTRKTPVTWGPIKARIRRCYPYTGYPIIAIVIIVSPIARLP